MKTKTTNVTKAIKEGACHVICGDGLEFDIKPLDGNVVILHHIEKDGKQALNNRVKMKLADADIFVTDKHSGITEVGEEKYVSISSDELRNPDAYKEDEEEFEATEDQEENTDDFADDDENGGYAEDDEEGEDAEGEDSFSDDEGEENEEGDMGELFGDDEEPSENESEGDDWMEDEEGEETPAAPEMPVQPMTNDSESVIAEDMIITGDIITKSSVTIRGGIDGNVTAVRSVTVVGGVNGDVNAGENVDVNNNGTDEATEVDGNITAKGNVFVDSNCVILGNIKAENAVIEGSVLGSVDVRNKITVCASARIKGDITSREIQVETGALIAGTCMQSYAETTADDFFGQYTSRLKEQQKDAENVKKSINSKSEDVTMKELI